LTFKIDSRSSLYALVAGFIMVVAPGAASAQSADRIAEADANGDGNISWQEMMDMRAATFTRLDRNKDGFVDANDSPRGPLKARFDEALAQLKTSDANRDGRISKNEMLNAPAPMFENGDTNGDKVLSAAELSALRDTALTKK
jgi:hypothetical protein